MVLIYAWKPSQKGVFRLPGADPAKTYRVFFIQHDRQLGAVVDLKPDSDSKQPVEVKLQPTAKVHGTVVNDNGTPAQGVQVQPMIAMGRLKEGEMTRSEILGNTEFYGNLMGQRAMLPYVTKILEPKPKGEFVIDTSGAGCPLLHHGRSGATGGFCRLSRHSSPAKIATWARSPSRSGSHEHSRE